MATINVFPQGFLIGDRYRVARLLGQGGMGMVYLVEDTQLDDELRAIKTIKPELLLDKKGAAYLKREAQASISLSHQNIVRIMNYEQWQSISYVIMEYVDGQTLEELLLENGPLSPQDFVPLALQICAGLEHSHSMQIVHQDIKPANIFINKRGTAKIADFGIARVLKDTATRMTGMMASGTLIYMSPESLKGQKPSVKSDIYSLGITFYEMLSGEPPFHRGDITWQHFNQEPEPLAGVPDSLNSAVLQTLAKDPGERPASAESLALMFTAGEAKVVTPAPTIAAPDKKQKQETLSGGDLYQQGIAAMEQQKLEEARDLFQQAIEADPKLEEIIVPDLSRCEYELQKLEEEQKAAREQEEKERLAARERQAELSRIPAYLIAAKRHLENEEHDKAKELYQKVLKLDPGNSEALEGIDLVEESARLAEEKLAKAEAELRQKQKKKEKAEQEQREKENENRRKAEAEKRKKRQELIKKHWWKVAASLLALIVIILFSYENEWLKAQNIKNSLTSFPIGNTGQSIKMVRIPSGSFFMDSEEGDSNEKPVRRVTISKDFYMGIYEVTQAQYQTVMGKNPSHFEGENNPVEEVSWNDAQEFCKKLSQLTGNKYRLPTEAEWEYSARAGTTTKYFWGHDDSIAGNYSWYNDNSNGKTHPVGEKLANAWGLHDMAGNVWEWCKDKWGSYPSGVVTDPKGAQNGDSRVFRGGSWDDSTRAIRSAIRSGVAPASWGDYIGFRVVRDVN